MRKKILHTFASFMLGLLLGSATYTFAQNVFTNAACPPPNCNVEQPVSTGAFSQRKQGRLTLNSSDGVAQPFAYGLIVHTGKVGIGTSIPLSGTNQNYTSGLEVKNGPIKTTDGLIIEVLSSDPSNPETGRLWLIQ